jgi:quercetin dioxygenase-like cupin family protein
VLRAASPGQEGDQMKVIRFDKAESYEPEKDWKRVSLCSETDVSVEYFVKPPEHASPRHQHPSAQVTIVLKGRMIISTDHGSEELSEGDAAYLPANEPHGIKNALTEISIGVDIFVPGRSFDFWLKRK